MQRKSFSLLGVVLMAAALLASCSENDSLGWNNALGDKVYGIWYADYQAQGTVGNDTPYSRVLQAVQLNANGTGKWWWAAFDAKDASKPLFVDGGQWRGEFDYATFSDGAITAKPKDEDSPMPRTLRYADGAITFNDNFSYAGDAVTSADNGTQTMKPAPEGFENVLQQLEAATYGADMENFNINDGDITAQNWRQQEAIYIYDGKGVDVKDSKGRTGYTLVALPWYNGTKLTNLPGDFCKDMTPENGWEWVVNYCGNRSIVNNNFFAVYNKYTGILRFFYYLPEGYSTGNDHVWQVSMTDNLAARTIIPYGVPNDRTLSNKAAINQTGQGTFVDYLTPWTDYKSNDGLIVPNAGWWAFDVDLSMTRPEQLADDSTIKLQMRSWSTQHSSLFSTMAANIDGTMRGTFEAQTTGTISLASTAKGIVGMLGQLGGPAGDVVSAYMGGDTKGALKKAVTLASGASNLASGKPVQGAPVEGNANLHTVGTYEGVINLLMKGTINTDGIISGSQPTVGIASPTLYLKDFDTKNSHLGQGVWNLKKTPVVYAIDSQSTAYYFGDGNRTGSANWMFFDPNSIEVELNPDVFPESDIEWVQVDAIAGTHKTKNWWGTDPFRQAIGMEPLASKTYTSWNKLFSYQYRGMYSAKNGETLPVSYDYTDEVNRYIFDFIGTGAYEGQSVDGMEFPGAFDTFDTGVTKKDEYGRDFGKVLIRKFGRSTGDYIIEPQLAIAEQGRSDIIWHFDDGYYDMTTCTLWDYFPYYFPDTEISVTVIVKMKSMSQPLIYSRNYLPDFEFLPICTDDAKIAETTNRLQERKNLHPKSNGHTETYDFQISRIQKCIQLITDQVKAEKARQDKYGPQKEYRE